MKLSANSPAINRFKRYAPPSLTMTIPVGYIVWRHINWKKNKPDSKKRMIIQQLSFWIAAIAGGILMHDTHFQRKPLQWKLPRFGLSSLLLMGGFEGGDSLAKALYPKPVNRPVSPVVMRPASFSPPQPALFNRAGWDTPAVARPNGLMNMQA